jgi:hypothetical protein
MSLTKLSPVGDRKIGNLFYVPRIIKLFPTRECLVSDIPAGDRKIGNLFTVYI